MGKVKIKSDPIIYFDDIIITKYYPTFWQKIKIRLFGLKHLSECRSEKISLDDFTNEWGEKRRGDE